MPYLNVTVLDDGTGSPVSGATVHIPGSVIMLTDGNGSAQIGVPIKTPDRLTVYASKTGYLNTSLTVEDASTRDGVTLYLKSGDALVVLTIKDSISGAAVAGATAYFDGNPGQPVINGQLSTHLPVGSHYVTVTAAGYDQQQVSFDVYSEQVTKTVDLVKTQAIQVPLKIVVAPNDATPAQTAGGTVSISGTGVTVVYQIGDDGIVITQDKYAVDTKLTIAASKEGFGSASELFYVSDGPVTYNLQLVADNAVGDGNDGQKVTSPAVVPASTKPADPYEWIYPSGAFGKYFTTSQARMYVGRLFIDELNSVQFALQANRIPVYGYCSRDFDAVGRGKALVQGQLAINFVSEGYLYTVLKEYARIAQQQVDDGQKLNSRLAALNVQRDQLEDILQSTTSLGAQSALPGTEDWLPDAESVQAGIDAINQEMQTLAAAGPQAVQDQRVQLAAFTAPVDPYPNAVYLPIPFTIEVDLTGAGRTVTRRLEKCYLTGNEQIYDQSGAVLLDVYSFIARRLR